MIRNFGLCSDDTVSYTHLDVYKRQTLFSAALTGIYMFRLLFLTFFGNFRGTEEQKHHLHESPIAMTLPLVVLAILSVVGGFLNLPHFLGEGSSQKLAHWLHPVYACLLYTSRCV